MQPGIPVCIKRAIHHSAEPDRLPGFFMDVNGSFSKQAHNALENTHNAHHTLSSGEVHDYVYMETDGPHHYQAYSSYRHLSVSMAHHYLSPTALSLSTPSGITSATSLLPQALASDFTNPVIELARQCPL